VGGADLDDPEHAARGGGLLGHHLTGEPVEGLDRVSRFRAAEVSTGAEECTGFGRRKVHHPISLVIDETGVPQLMGARMG
jgi:hypothetical protein